MPLIPIQDLMDFIYLNKLLLLIPSPHALQNEQCCKSLSVSGLTKARAEGRQNVRLGGEKMLPAERTDEIN